MSWRGGGWLLFFGGLSAAAAGCGSHGAESPGGAAAAAQQQAPIVVTVAPLEHRTVNRSIDDLEGNLIGWENVTVGAKREGRVRRVRFDMADRVEPGALLVELETEDADLAVQQADRQLQAELAKLGLYDVPAGEFDVASVPSVIQAEVMLNKARQNLARERSLHQRNAGTLQDLQNAENDVRGYEAALAAAILTARSTLVGAQAMKVLLAVSRYRRSEMEIHAPVPSILPEGVTSGLTYAVARRRVAEGQMLKQGDAVAELVIENPLRLQVKVPERYIGDVQVGQALSFVIRAHPGTIFEGKVARVSPRVDDNRSFQVEAHIPNNRGLLRPGGFAKASIVISTDSRAKTVPIGSDHDLAGVRKIFVVEGDRARAIPVKLGIQGKGWVEVIGDLPETAQVVTTGQVHLAEGTPVIIRRDPPPVARAESPKPD
jgi:multidrug efflux pump subunit AcrA (membrane-fusion protein)